MLLPEFLKGKTLYSLVTIDSHMPETVTIPRKEYERLKKMEDVDKELLEDIAHGIKDVLNGKIKEV